VAVENSHTSNSFSSNRWCCSPGEKRVMNHIDVKSFNVDFAVDDRLGARFGRDPDRDRWFFHRFTRYAGNVYR
jgi:hypothetical protein